MHQYFCAPHFAFVESLSSQFSVTVTVPDSAVGSPRLSESMTLLLDSMNKSTMGPTTSFTGESVSSPSMSSARAEAIVSMGWKSSSMGKRSPTDIRLNMSCTVAPAKALSNSNRSPAWPIDTMVLVTVVPMLAPMMMGTAGRTWSPPAETKATTMDVLVEEDCTITVASTPTIKAARLFGMSRSVFPAPLPPNTLKALPINSMPTRKK
mmetsp:Transcript_68764/g.143607  ORF Transcript_68764/g.143607 Transcript_68764/m.143607 type:complete len:208 (-) Transcript_68764:230-853(-)